MVERESPPFVVSLAIAIAIVVSVGFVVSASLSAQVPGGAACLAILLNLTAILLFRVISTACSVSPFLTDRPFVQSLHEAISKAEM